MIPKFAVVGRVNEGKSSVIATLTENDQIAMSPIPGTTRKSRSFNYVCGDTTILTVFDTPGFQEPERAFAWLQDKAKGPATERPEIVAEFVHQFAGDEDFVDECELLKPILDGAAILYVVDASHPYRSSYEAEFEILRWTGRPRMALINSIRDEDYSQDWKKSLSQHFNLIFDFNAHAARFDRRLALLEALRLLDEKIAPGIDRAIAVFSAEKRDRQRDCAGLIAGFLTQALTYQLISSGKETDQLKGLEQYRAHIRKLEVDLRKDMRKRFHFSTSFEEQVTDGVATEDVFSERTWRVLGLDTKQLVAVAATAGATFGLGIDVALGGSSLLLGATLGALAAAGSTAWWANDTPTLKQYGIEFSGTKTAIGPIKSPNWPWLLLDRCLIYFSALLGRTHAMSGDLDEKSKEGITTKLDKKTRDELGKEFALIRKNRASGKLDELILELIRDIDGPERKLEKN